MLYVLSTGLYCPQGNPYCLHLISPALIQTVAVTAEDWDEAAALEDRIKELSERSAAASGTATQEEQRAVQMYERRQDLISQQSKVNRESDCKDGWMYNLHITRIART